MNTILTRETAAEVEKELLAEQERRSAEDQLSRYAPYAVQREFHNAGSHARERLFMAGNRVGKTMCGCAELAFHLSGAYPDWWAGKRFDKPIRAWAAGVTSETTRDVLQSKLIGPPQRSSEWGRGMIPKALIGEVSHSRGIQNLIDTVSIRHVSGGWSTLQFKSYERGQEKWQGVALECVLLDEEPDLELYTEALTRTNETGGIVFMLFTPLRGVSGVVHRFIDEGHPDRAVITATINDAAHFSAEDRARIIASYPKHELDARTKGIPQLGSGRIFPISEEQITCERFKIPRHWPVLGAMDLGWDHPFAAVKLAWDRDHDAIYVTHAYRIREATPPIHVGAIRSWGATMPWAWPRDGRQETLAGAGISLARQYGALGLNMMHLHAQFEDDRNVSVEAGLMLMLTKMEAGKFWVFDDLRDWFSEFRLYHRKDGKVVKEGDDLLCATRYGVMMLRFAETGQPPVSRITPRHARASDGWMSS